MKKQFTRGGINAVFVLVMVFSLWGCGAPQEVPEVPDKLESPMQEDSSAFAEMLETAAMPADIIKAKGMEQVSDSSVIESLVDQVIAENPKDLSLYEISDKGVTAEINYSTGEKLTAFRGTLTK